MLSSSVGGAWVGSHSSSRYSRTVTRSGRTHVPFWSEPRAEMRAASASRRVRNPPRLTWRRRPSPAVT